MTDPTTAAPRWRRRAKQLVAAALVPAMLAGCAKSPATGERIFTGGFTKAQGREVGAEQHPKLVKEFGGAFDEPKITGYVSELGNRLARRSEMPGLDWSFTVIDSPIVNAFALPGGYIHVTRGLVSLAENEAELAGVLGHEIGHVTARHTAERYGGSVLANVAGLAGAIFLGRQAAQAINTLSAVALQSYSRSQEFEADTLGVRYLRRTGYDARAMATFLDKLRADSKLQAAIRGLPEESVDQFNIMQTHPRTADRVEKAIREARDGAVDGELGRDRFLQKLDGMRVGSSREQGFVRGQTFLHPELRIAFEVPERFRLINRPDQVAALGPDGAQIAFTMARPDRPVTPYTYLTREWAKDARLSGLERLEVNGRPAATATTRVRTNRGARDLRLVAVGWDERRIYRFMFITPPGQTARFRTDFRRTTHSLRRLPEAEADALQPLRLTIHTVQPGETVAELAARMPYSEFKERRFRVLNGLDGGTGVTPGQKVKLVVAGDGDASG